MRNESRVSFAPILAGMITAGGALLCFAYFGRSLGVNGPVAYQGAAAVAAAGRQIDPGFSGILFALLANAVSFGFAGYVIATLGTFRSSLAAALHGAVAFSAMALAIYYSGRGALMVGRPGFPFGFPDPALFTGITAEMSWANFVGIFSGAIACCAGAYWTAELAARAEASPSRREEMSRDRAA